MTGSSQSWRAAEMYRCFDANERLLYIGVTSTRHSRFREHGRKSPWWSEVSRIEVTAFERRQDAFDAERAAIVAEHPLHNARCHYTDIHRPEVVQVEAAS